MTEPTKREKGLRARATAIEAAINALDMEWPAKRREELNMTEHGRALVWIYDQDRAALVESKRMMETTLRAADSFALFYVLEAKDRKAFDALAVLAQIELDRKPEAVAA